MAIFNIACPDCKKKIKCSFGQSNASGDVLSWHRSIECSHCGVCIEIDDKGFPPEQYREAIIIEQGLWQLTIQSDRTKSVLLAHILRQLLELDLKQAINLSKKIPGSIFSGTKVEMEWICEHIVDGGLIANISSCSSPILDIASVVARQL